MNNTKERTEFEERINKMREIVRNAGGQLLDRHVVKEPTGAEYLIYRLPGRGRLVRLFVNPTMNHFDYIIDSAAHTWEEIRTEIADIVQPALQVGGAWTVEDVHEMAHEEFGREVSSDDAKRILQGFRSVAEGLIADGNEALRSDISDYLGMSGAKEGGEE